MHRTTIKHKHPTKKYFQLRSLDFITMLHHKDTWRYFIKLCPLTTYRTFNFAIVKYYLPNSTHKIQKATIKKLYVKEGDNVQSSQKLAFAIYDKHSTQLTAHHTGTIHKILFKQEDTYKVGDLLLELDVQQNQKLAQSDSQQPKDKDKIKDKDKNLHKDKIMEQSKRFSEKLISWTWFGYELINFDGQSYGRILLTVPFTKVAIQAMRYNWKMWRTRLEKAQKMSSYELQIDKIMEQSRNIPHVYLSSQFDITNVKQQIEYLSKYSKKVSIFAIIIKTFSLALKKQPMLNSWSWHVSDSQPYKCNPQSNHHFIIPIQSPKGGVVWRIMKNVDKLNIQQIQGELERLKKQWDKYGKYGVCQLLGGTVCLSFINYIDAAPLVLFPQVCNVYISKPRYIPSHKKGKKLIMNVRYGCDLRVIDSENVADFNNTWKYLIQNVQSLTNEML